jgi:hypothetical protein
MDYRREGIGKLTAKHVIPELHLVPHCTSGACPSATNSPVSQAHPEAREAGTPSDPGPSTAAVKKSFKEVSPRVLDRHVLWQSGGGGRGTARGDRGRRLQEDLARSEPVSAAQGRLAVQHEGRRHGGDAVAHAVAIARRDAVVASAARRGRLFRKNLKLKKRFSSSGSALSNQRLFALPRLCKLHCVPKFVIIFDPLLTFLL